MHDSSFDCFVLCRVYSSLPSSQRPLLAIVNSQLILQLFGLTHPTLVQGNTRWRPYSLDQNNAKKLFVYQEVPLRGESRFLSACATCVPSWYTRVMVGQKVNFALGKKNITLHKLQPH